MNGLSQQRAPSIWEGVHHFDQGKSEITVAQQGAHLLSWCVDGVEQLYLSPLASTDGTTPIRGGVPVCFPQFNMRGDLPKHGFARTLPWRLVAREPHPCFELCSSASTRAIWPFDFVMRLTFEMSDIGLRMVWSVHNTGLDALSFTGALHTYLRVDSLDATMLHGLQDPPLTFASEFDRIYTAPPSDSPMQLEDGKRIIDITQSESFAHTVVWNPHAELCRQIADLPNDGYQHYVCVEAAQVLSPITVPAGDTWTGWQQLNVLTSRVAK
jgi:glucose-6-phosphate 1-epimerase